MTTGLDVLPGHTGICHRARGFIDPELERIGGRVEQEFSARFLAHRVVMRIVPIEIDFRARSSPTSRALRRKTKDYVGEGVAMRLDTMSGYEGDPPPWLVSAEADMIVHQRAASKDEWMPVRPLEMVESLLREQAEVYLKELELDRMSISHA